MAGYWAKRIDEQSNRLYDRTYAQTQQQLGKYYKSALAAVRRDIEALYDKIMEDGGPQGTNRTIDLYRYGRFFELQNKLTTKLTELGLAEISIYDKNLLKMYNEVQSIITKNSSDRISNSYVQLGRAEEVLKSIWCSDGKNWSDRIWSNKALLQSQIEKGLIDCVVRGVSKDEVVKMVMNSFGTGFSNADRITRTELNFVQNQAAADRYQAAGVTHYEILAAMDERTSEICEEQDGKKCEFAKMQVGINAPPFHPNCRTTILPVLED